MEMEFMVYNLVFIMKMTVYTIWLVCLKGRASAISFYGWDFEWTSWIWNIRFVMNHSWCLYSRNQTSPKPIIYVDIWIYNFMIIGQPWILLQFTNHWSAWHHRATAHYRRRLTQYITNAIALINPDYYYLLINFCHTSRADTICAVSL